MASVKGLATLTANLKGVKADVRKEVFAAVYAAGDLIATEAQLSITKGSVSGKLHVPSKPGEPPNADTRQLDKGIIVQPFPAELKAQIISTAPYSAYLELGTSRMAARPFMRPALLYNSKAALDLIQRATARAVARSGATT